MKNKKKIKLIVELDEKQVPEKIFWKASDMESPQYSETKSVSLSLWDHTSKNTLRIDLWSKDMPSMDMKRFCVDCIGGMGQSIFRSTDDKYMNKEINELCERLTAYLQNNELKNEA